MGSPLRAANVADPLLFVADAGEGKPTAPIIAAACLNAKKNDRDRSAMRRRQRGRKAKESVPVATV